MYYKIIPAIMRSEFIALLFSLVLVLILFGCRKEIIEKDKEQRTVEDQGVKINKEQKIVDLMLTNLTGLETIDTIEYGGVKFPVYELRIEVTEEEAESIEPGVVMYIPTGIRGGMTIYVYEVGSIKKSTFGSKGTIALMIKGFQTTLDMYFNYENAVLEFSTPDNRSKTNSGAPNKLVGSDLNLGGFDIGFTAQIDSLEFTSSPDKLCQLTISNKLWGNDTSSYISVSGTVSIHPAIDLYMKYEPQQGGDELIDFLEAAAVPDALLLTYKDKNYFLGNMKRLWTNIYTDFDRELTFNIHLKDELDIEPYRVPLGSLLIPSVPVSVSIETAFEIDFGVLGTVDLEIYTKNQDDIVLGIDLDRDLAEPIWYYEYDCMPKSGIKLLARVEVTTGISLILETEVYVSGVIGPEISIAGFLEALASVSAGVGTGNPMAANWKLSANTGIRGDASLNLSAFHSDLATWEMWEMLQASYTENIYLAPDHLKIEQGNDQVGILGQALPLPIIAGAYDSRDSLITYLPVPLHFETNNGSTDPSGMILTSDGTASTIWTLDNVNEVQLLNVYILDGLDKLDEVTVNATAKPGSEPEEGTFIDGRDSNEYKWRKMGSQIWMAENLAYLPSVSPPSSGSYTTEYYYVLDYTGFSIEEAIMTSNYNTYGVLYNWPAAMDACPDGWHLPSDEDWKDLEIYLGMNPAEADGTGYRGSDEGSKLAGNAALWIDNVLESNPAFGSSGFTALPGTYRSNTGSFREVGYSTLWWSSTVYSGGIAWYRNINNSSSRINRSYTRNDDGLSVRCIRD